ncbi:protease complex subunit PrcB family protein [Tumebacillus permanentifrigoris]|uniref:S-layer family protein n=1 Tax=Tumebacillus permanentifrigoris TaxID=378543 RepID=A0A316DG69_9BACL|nr:protease complex subunit PrcB family protein [Tumebacillus permanentifrigoris]PWK15563.1 S-layer family protein [Tumebacillus permanentifrigoris]
MKKTITALMAAALTLTSASAVFAVDSEGKFIAPHRNAEATKLKHAAPVQYQDLGNHFAMSSVERLTNYDMIGRGTVGGQQSTFEPNSQSDRTELKTWFKNALGKEVKDSSTSSNVSRLEVATWLASSLPALNTGINGANLTAPYTDTANVTVAERDSLNQLYKLGIMVGDGQGHFNPKGLLTRGEAAVLLDGALARTLTAASKSEFEQVSGALPETVQTVANENRTEPGVYSVVDNGVRYLVISGGEAPTGGYSVNVDGVQETAAGYFVSASLQHPDPTMMVPQMITYPQAVLKVKDAEKSAYLAQ